VILIFGGRLLIGPVEQLVRLLALRRRGKSRRSPENPKKHRKRLEEIGEGIGQLAVRITAALS